MKIILINIQVSYANYADSLFLDGNKHYSIQDYNGALDMYEKLLGQGYEHSDLYYNLGNAYYRQNQIGQSIWAYHKALKIEPRNKDLWLKK